MRTLWFYGCVVDRRDGVAVGPVGAGNGTSVCGDGR